MDDGVIRCIVLEQATEEELVRTLRRRLPNESCGAIYGSTDGERAIAEGFVLIRNASSDPERTFRFHPEDWVSAYYGIQKNQREIVGLFHSHPYGSPSPSETDAGGSLPWGTYWIVGISEESHRIAVYRRDGGQSWKSLPIERPL